MTRFTKKGNILVSLGLVVATLLISVIILAACGPSTPTQYAAVLPTPTPPPTPANYNNVPDAATVAIRGSLPTATAISSQFDNSNNVGSNPGYVLVTDTPDLLATIAASGSNQVLDLPTFGLPPDNNDGNISGGVNPTQLSSLLGTPGPLPGQSYINPTLAGTKGSGVPSRPLPTPTLNTGPNQAKIINLSTTKVTFQNAYHFALAAAVKMEPDARVIFASANVLSSSRTVWTFLFVWLAGNRAWRVIYDSNAASPDITEVAPPGRLVDAELIDMNRVLDTPQLILKATANGLQTLLPVDIVSFEVDGVIHQPCFIMTNVSQGKQVVINAYTGEVVRNEFFG